MDHKLEKIQRLLQENGLDGWLFTDYHGHDHITRDFLQLTDRFCTRRLFYLIPAQGQPVKLLSAIEPLLLDHLPGEKRLYHGIRGQREALASLLLPGQKIAAQYSPMGNVPTISTMDAGLVEYLRSFGIEPVSSADLMQHFGAVLTEAQIESHRQAGVIIHRILDETFSWIRQQLNAGIYLDEWLLLQHMKEIIAQQPIYMDSPPFFGIDDHAANPGYEPEPEGSYQIKEGSRLIVDIAGRLPQADAIYYDVSWCMNVGAAIDPEYQRWFDLVKEARQMAFDMIQSRLDTGQDIGHRCHGIGANLDDYETHDDRRLLPSTMFSIEPGIYAAPYGVRLEYDVHITPERKLRIYGPVQEEILII